MKPIMFTDIDGVLNVIPKKHGNPNKLPHLKAWSNWETFTYSEKNPNYVAPDEVSNYRAVPKENRRETIDYIITYSPDLISRLNEMKDRVDIVFLTTWKHLAVEVFAPKVGLEGVFPVADADGSESHHGSLVSMAMGRHKRWWKINAVLDYLDKTPAPFIIFDDLLFSTAKKYIRNSVEHKGIPSMMFTTFDTIGIEPKMLDDVDEFLSNL